MPWKQDGPYSEHKLETNSKCRIHCTGFSTDGQTGLSTVWQKNIKNQLHLMLIMKYHEVANEMVFVNQHELDTIFIRPPEKILEIWK